MELTEVVTTRISKAEKELVKKSAEAVGKSISAYLRTKACVCGEKGYEGIFTAVDWKCGKCGKKNHWRVK
jgi:hypothetical protein